MITRQTRAFVLMFMFQAEGEPSTARTKLTGAVATTKNTNGINFLNLSKIVLSSVHSSHSFIVPFRYFINLSHQYLFHLFIHLPFYPLSH